ncbi:apolipoprotein N-acyltransferase [Salinispirillum sp. LH 10-3-1]|uniref:Apolipoprotein N-acyltransferase n=1 Tax=Salinispirillum sp. LH 10-3-1 TaxID=2952525 RepID=A0AB38YI01_9GAMM
MIFAAQIYALTEKHWPARWILLLTGALVPLIFAPFFIWPLAYALPIVFWWLTAQQNPREAFLRGWFFGIGFFGTGVSWVYASMRTVETPVAISLVLTAAFCVAMGLLFALQAWLPAKVRRRYCNDAPLHWMLFPLLWLAFEGVRTTLFTGMPWLLWGTLATDNWLRGWLPVTGVFGVSFLLLFGAALLWQWRYRVKALMPTAFAAGFLVLSWGVGFALTDRHYTQPSLSQPMPVAAVQGNTDQSIKWDTQILNEILSIHLALTDRETEAALVLWAETAIPTFPDAVPGFIQVLEQRAVARDQAIISGLPLRGEGRVYYNGIKAWGNGAGEYRKQHLVPFGEYLPLQSVLQGLIAFFDLPMSGFTPGPTGQAAMTMQYAGTELKLAPLICYEAAYPNLSRQQALDSDVLIVISNDAWFGGSLAPEQHLQITRARTIENQRPMVRATQNGISVILDEHGQVLARAPQFVQATVSGEILPRNGITPFQRLGSWPVMLLTVLLSALGLFWTLRTARR